MPEASAMRIESSDVVGEVMRRYPATIRAFIRHHLHCPGCAFSSFCTLAYACDAHSVPSAGVLADLRRAARRSELSAVSPPPTLEEVGDEGPANR